ncbi:hypothetical protein BU15DRAFT_74677 [Melanogaster broomeanus]|nr:hypothetical protein BU15DRAFT_74677 [Melanogaster broomeanus]
MPPKRRTPAKAATPAAKAAPPPAQSTSAAKPTPHSSKPAPAPPAPIPPPPPPPPQPVETSATKVRKEWKNFIDTWYDPQNKKLLDKLRKDLILKYKNLGSSKDTQKLREMELFEKLDSIAAQLAQPARTEWERRLEAAGLREDQWDDMTGEEQQAVLGVFVGFFGDEDVEEPAYDDQGPDDLSFVEDDESAAEEPQHPGLQSFLPSSTAPSTPSRGTFELVNPSSFFLDATTPSNPTKNLPALSMDHLATLGPSNAGRSAEPGVVGVGGVLGFQGWASEAGIATQQTQAQISKPSTSVSTSQTLSARLRATDISRQQSAASNGFLSTPQNLFATILATESVYQKDTDPMDEELLKSKMAADFQEYKVSLRMQMIYKFHAEAAQIEIKLVETLLTDEGTKESRARAVQEHETSMMLLREQKEEERKMLCAEEREKRREQMKRHIAQVRHAQNKEVDPRTKANSVEA